MALSLPPPWRRWLSVGLLALLGVLFILGTGADLMRPLGMGRLQTGCRDYLDRSQTRAFTTFVTLSLVKGGLGVLEGSTASLSLLGTGVEVEVGDMAQSAYDTVDFAWRVMLVSYVALFLAEVLVLLGELVGGFLLGAASLTAALYLIIRRRRSSPARSAAIPCVHREWSSGSFFIFFFYRTRYRTQRGGIYPPCAVRFGGKSVR